MVVRGHVENGVVVLEDGVRLLEGQDVTVIAPSADTSNPDASVRQVAWRGLIGVW